MYGGGKRTRGTFVGAEKVDGNGRFVAWPVAIGITPDGLLIGGRAVCSSWGYNTAAAAAPGPMSCHSPPRSSRGLGIVFVVN